MSSMLEQAIIDAEQLKETAQRTAEEAVIEKYQSEIKNAVDAILEQQIVEQEEAAMVIDEEGAKVVEDLPSAQLDEEDNIVEINLDKLEEMIAQEVEEGTISASDMLEREEVLEDLEEELDEEIELDEDIDDLLEDDSLDEEIELDEDIDDLLEDEELDEDLSLEEIIAETLEDMLSEDDDILEEDEDLFEEEEAEEDKESKGEKKTKSLAKQAPPHDEITQADFKNLKPGVKYVKESSKLQRENKTLIKEQTRMSSKVQLLENKLDKYGTVINQLKQKLDESNLTNAKLLYQNRILNSISLNERQKDKIVEAISNATTVEEAKIIFETLQSAVGLKSKKTRKQESLNEVVTRSSSAFIPRKEVKPNTDAFSDRMKRLAGLK